VAGSYQSRLSTESCRSRIHYLLESNHRAIEKLFNLNLPPWKEENLDQCMDITHLSEEEWAKGKTPSDEEISAAGKLVRLTTISTDAQLI
jgi:hypothetical protein